MEAIPSFHLNTAVSPGTSRTSLVHVRGATIVKSRNTIISTSILITPSILELTPLVLQTRVSCENYLWQKLVGLDFDTEICYKVAPQIAEVAMAADSALRVSGGGLGFQLMVTLDCLVTYRYRLDTNPINLIYGGNRFVIDKLRSTGIEEQCNVQAAGTCAVCLDDLLLQLPKTELLRMPCSHLFHDRCIVPWLERNNSCPMCRKSIA